MMVKWLKKTKIPVLGRRGPRRPLKMKRSRFFPPVCNCQMSVDKIWKLCVDAAVLANKALGQGQSEKAYESVIADTLYQQRMPVMRQVKYFSTVHNSIHETGIVDLEVDQQVIVELKAGYNTITDDHKIQAKRYLRSAEMKYEDLSLIHI